MKDKHDQNQSTQLDEILRELEVRFAGETSSKHPQKKSRKPFFSSFTHSQIIGGLTLVLLVVGAAVGLYLGQTNQELRQQASIYFPQCTNTSGVCSNTAAGGACAGGTCQNTETDGNCTCVPGSSATTTPAGSVPNCSANPFCNPSCSGDNTCNKLVCIGIVSGSSPFARCMWGGQEVTLSSCDNQSCGPAPTETCTQTGFCVGGSNSCCNGEVPVFNPNLCNANSRTWCPPAATGILPTATSTQPTNQPTTPPNQPTNPPLATNTSVPTTPGAPTNTSVPLPTNTATIALIPTNTLRPTNTSVPVPTNTSVPTTPGAPTNTPVPVPTNTTVPLATFTPISSIIPTTTSGSAPVISVTATATSTPNTVAGNTSTPLPTQTAVSNQSLSLPQAGNANQNVQFVLASISLAVLVGAVVLLFFL